MNPDHPPQTAVVRLADETIEQLAARVADLLTQRTATVAPAPSDRAPRPSGLLTAADVSTWWGVERGWVYQHADELGAIRLGTGRRPRLRFDPDRVRSAMGDPPNTAAHEPGQPRRGRKPRAGGSRSSTADACELLPIHGEQRYVS